MTDSDLATCRAWCAANNVTVTFRGRGNYLEYYPRGLPALIASLENDWAEPHEHLVYAKLWKHLQPWHETVSAMFKTLEAENTALRKLATNVVRHEDGCFAVCHVWDVNEARYVPWFEYRAKYISNVDKMGNEILEGIVNRDR